jgi:hypothetical protein
MPIMYVLTLIVTAECVLTMLWVAGEIRTSERRFDTKVLEYGAILGVTTTWILYVLVTIAFVRF